MLAGAAELAVPTRAESSLQATFCKIQKLYFNPN
jgi:hypothetical protein